MLVINNCDHLLDFPHPVLHFHKDPHSFFQTISIPQVSLRLSLVDSCWLSVTNNPNPFLAVISIKNLYYENFNFFL